jgi:SAM-dependent methyltransferase
MTCGAAMGQAHDEQTLAFYEREAAAYASQTRRAHPALAEFLSKLPPGARILELGCGGGADAEVMLAAGFDVKPTDGSPALAAEAGRRLGRPVRVVLFEEIDEVEAYDAVWASAALLHVPEERLAQVLERIRRAMKPRGLFYASFKAGQGGGRDRFGRYFNFPTRERLEQAYAAAGGWSDLELRQGEGGGYDGVTRTWLSCLARKP